VVASKFDDFTSTCLRTPGAAWTAALGPLDYLGVKMAPFRSLTMDSGLPVLTLDVPSISKAVATSLLDMPANDAERVKILQASDSDRYALWSLALMVSQLAVRFALLEHELEGTAPPASTPALRVLFSAAVVDGSTNEQEKNGSTCPLDCIVESLLSLDLCLDNYTVDTFASCFVAPSSSVEDWIKKNKLSP
jgi:hypothetical protein